MNAASMSEDEFQCSLHAQKGSPLLFLPNYNLISVYISQRFCLLEKQTCKLVTTYRWLHIYRKQPLICWYILLGNAIMHTHTDSFWIGNNLKLSTILGMKTHGLFYSLLVHFWEVILTRIKCCTITPICFQPFFQQRRKCLVHTFCICK